ncbi:apolipoprotein N-acyltransferase [Luteolibacter yonseiensis]
MRIAAAVVGGLLVAGAFPPLDFTWLVWIGMMPVLWALWSLEGTHLGRKGFGIGYLAGLAACLVQFNWVASVSWLGAILLPMYLAVYWGLFGIFAAKIGNPWKPGNTAHLVKTAFCHGAVWAGCELLRGWVITGIGWNVLGTTFHDTPVMAQAADIFGVAGLSMVLVFFQAMLVQAAARRSWQGIRVMVRVLALLALYGIFRIHHENKAESLKLKTLLVQLNIPQDAGHMLWTDLETHQGYEDETLKALDALKSPEGRFSPDWPDWVMWPECALTGRILRAPDGDWGTAQINQDTLAQVYSAGPFSLIYGVVELDGEKHGDQLALKDKGNTYNSLAVATPDNDLQTYRKRHLVIFGETVPLIDSVPFLRKIYEQQAGAEYYGSMTPGDSLEPLTLQVGGREIGGIPTVCFEDSVPRLTRKFVRPGPQVIVNVTNDGWFKESAAAEQHFQYARFRAIELRRPMLRSANSGVSAAIDTTGSTKHPVTGKTQILTDENGSHFTRGSLLTELKVPLNPSFSLYAAIGDWGLIGLALLGLFMAIFTKKTEPGTFQESR